MDIFYTIVTKEAAYYFVANSQYNLVRITRLVLKGQKGYHRSTTMSIDNGRKFARRLKAK
jgi:hypothetical protein